MAQSFSYNNVFAMRIHGDDPTSSILLFLRNEKVISCDCVFIEFPFGKFFFGVVDFYGIIDFALLKTNPIQSMKGK